MNRPKFDGTGLRGPAMDRKPLFCLALSVLAGLAAAWNCTQLSFLGRWLLGAAVLLAAAVFFVPKGKLALACAAALLFAASGLYLSLPGYWNGDELAGGEYWFSARVSETVSGNTYAVLTLTDVSMGEERAELSAIRENLRLELQDPERVYEAGDRLLLRARALSPAEKNYRGDTDEKSLAYTQRIRFFLRPDEAEVLILGHEAPQGIAAAIGSLRGWITERIDAAFSEDCAGFIKALTVGETRGMPGDLRSDFAKLGLSHVLAISGLHVSLLFEMIQKIGRKLRIWPHGIHVVSYGMLAAYLVIADFRLSLLRVVYMQLIKTLAEHQCRKYDPLSALSAAFLIQILVTPSAFLDMGFQMSYLSTAAILLFTQWLSLLDKTKFRFLTPIALTAVVMTVSFPYLALCGLDLAPASFLGNLIFVPLMPVVLLGCFVWLILLPLFPAGAPLLTMALEWAATAYLSGIGIFAQEAELLPILIDRWYWAFPYWMGLLYLAPCFGSMGIKERAAAIALSLLCLAGMLIPSGAAQGIYVIGEGEVCALWIASPKETCLVMEEPLRDLSQILRERHMSHADRLILTGSAQDASEILRNVSGLSVGRIEFADQAMTGEITLETETLLAGQGRTVLLEAGHTRIRFGPQSLMGGAHRVEIERDGETVTVACCPWQADADENVGLNGVYRLPWKE